MDQLICGRSLAIGEFLNIFFKLRTEAFIHLPSVYALTVRVRSVICPHNALSNLVKVEKDIHRSNSYKVSGKHARHLTNTPWSGQQPGSCLQSAILALKSKTINFSKVITVLT